MRNYSYYLIVDIKLYILLICVQKLGLGTTATSFFHCVVGRDIESSDVDINV